MTIRKEQPKDYDSILKLTYEAFKTLDFPGRRRVDEHYLVALLGSSQFVIPELSFVAEQNGEIVGNILYTHSRVIMSDGTEKPTITFGPLSVLPQRQKTGVGRALVNHSMNRAREMGFGAVMITGVPDYYPRLGFARAREYGLTLTDGSADDAFMAYELVPGYLSGGGVLHFNAINAFEKAETDEEDFSVFHKQFMLKNFSERLVLRPFFEGDIDLMKRWLKEPHVAKWYEHPEHWLRELSERRGAFSFITHFIAEYEGVPIGFCQYYDTHFAQEHEVWNEEWNIAGRQGEIFSVDYLIGEPEYLRRGFGSQMIALLLKKLRKTGAKTVIVEPEKENTASGRALESAGFQYNVKTYSLNL